MARTKKVLKAKEPVKIRFKELSNGNKSIYLDIYRDGVRTYEFLKLYLIPERDEASKTANENTLRQANAIKSQMVLDITNNVANISKASSRTQMLLLDWMQTFREYKVATSQSDGYPKNIDKTIKHLIKYRGSKVTLKQVDKTFCLGFITFLQTAKQSNGKKLSANTIRNYYKIFSSALNKAVRDDVLASNPFDKIAQEDRPKQKESDRAFLDIDEVKALMQTPCKNTSVKRAFLFSCFTGLRCSDVEALKWENLSYENGKLMMDIKIIKTGRPYRSSLSQMAIDCLPDRGDAKDTDKVFGFPKSNYHNVVLKEWAKDAKIGKSISFHVSRHSFATLGITADVDLYVVSKLMGHTQIKTTQIYAKLIDKKKDEGVNAVSNLFEK